MFCTTPERGLLWEVQSSPFPSLRGWFVIKSDFWQLEAAVLTSTFSLCIVVECWHRHNFFIEVIYFALGRQTRKLCMPIMRNLYQQNLLYRLLVLRLGWSDWWLGVSPGHLKKMANGPWLGTGPNSVLHSDWTTTIIDLFQVLHSSYFGFFFLINVAYNSAFLRWSTNTSNMAI